MRGSISRSARVFSRSAQVSDPDVIVDRRSHRIRETFGQPGGSVGRPATARIGRPATALATALLFLLLLVPSAIHAGTVETAEGRFEGELTFLPDAVKVGEKEIAFADVLYLLADRSTGVPAPAANLVRLKNGEVWAGKIVGGSTKQVDVQSNWYGKKSIDLESVSTLDFLPKRAASSGTKPKTLYRERHPPVPGSLMWIDPDTLGLDSPLGSITIKRTGLVRYVLANEPDVLPGGDSDEIGLVDGNVFRGRLEATADGLSFQNDLGGNAKFPAGAVRFIVRHNPNLIEFSQLAAPVVQTGESPLDKGTQLAIADAPAAGDSDASFARALRIEPKIRITYTLPNRDGKQLLCRATLDPIDGSTGDTHIRFLIGKEVVVDETLTPTDRQRPVDVPLPEGDELKIELNFGPLLRFPCGVLLQDPHLIFTEK